MIYNFNFSQYCPKDEVCDAALEATISAISEFFTEFIVCVYDNGFSIITTEKIEQDLTYLASIATFIFNEEYNKEYLLHLDYIDELVLKRDLARKKGTLFTVNMEEYDEEV